MIFFICFLYLGKRTQERKEKSEQREENYACKRGEKQAMFETWANGPTLHVKLRIHPIKLQRIEIIAKKKKPHQSGFWGANTKSGFSSPSLARVMYHLSHRSRFPIVKGEEWSAREVQGYSLMVFPLEYCQGISYTRTTDLKFCIIRKDFTKSVDIEVFIFISNNSENSTYLKFLEF